ncbi:MAG: lysylphosphatidylglycerol synthase transmembrane domain-containing protein [Acidimicrobiia bacterium]
MAAQRLEGDGVDATAPRRARWIVVLRLAVSAGLLAVVVTHIPDFGEIIPDDDYGRTSSYLALGVFLAALGVVLSAWRWQRVLLVLDTRIPLRPLVSLTAAGLFVGNALPGTIGGDVLRVSRITKITGSGTTGFTSVALERLTGFVALPVLTLLAFLIEPSLLDHQRAWIALAIAGGTLLALGALVFLAGHPRIAGRFAGHENWMRFIGAVHLGIDDLRRRPRDVIGVLGAAIAYQVSVVLSVLCLVKALEIDVPVAAVVAFIPAVAMAQVIPISLSGFGVREGLLVLFLHAFGVPTAKAVAVGLCWYGMTLIVSLAGAPSFAVGSRNHSGDTVGTRASP